MFDHKNTEFSLILLKWSVKPSSSPRLLSFCIFHTIILQLLLRTNFKSRSNTTHFVQNLSGSLHQHSKASSYRNSSPCVKRSPRIAARCLYVGCRECRQMTLRDDQFQGMLLGGVSSCRHCRQSCFFSTGTSLLPTASSSSGKSSTTVT